MDVTEARQKYLAAKKAVGDCTKSIQTLQAKADHLQDSLPGLTRAVEDAEKTKTAALDNFALHGNKESESELKRARAGCESAIKQQSETNELIESVARTLKRQESEFGTLQAQKDSWRHQVWLSLFEAKVAEIPETIRAAVRELICIGLNSNRGMFFILPEVFPLPTNTEIQQIYKRLSTDLGIE